MELEINMWCIVPWISKDMEYVPYFEKSLNLKWYLRYIYDIYVMI